MKKTNRERIKRLAIIAILAALEVVLTQLYIKVGAINLNFGLTCIILAAVLLGPVEGFTIGAVSGLVTGIQVLSGNDPFYLFLIQTNPVAAFILCIAKTALAGLAAAFIYRLFAKFCKVSYVNMIAASVICPVVNTGLFAIAMLSIFGNAMMANETIASWANGAGLVFLVFVVLIGINFFVELILNVVVAPAAVKAVQATKIIK